jgi:hypothetical protein
MPQKVSCCIPSKCETAADHAAEFEMLHDDEVIPKYAADIVIGRVKGQEVRLEY